MRSTSIVIMSLVGLIAGSTIPQDNSRTNILDLTSGKASKSILAGNYQDNSKNNLLTGNSRNDEQDNSRNNVLNGAGKNLDQNQVKGNSILDVTNNNNDVGNSPTRADNNRIADHPKRLDRSGKRAILGGLGGATPQSNGALKPTTVVSRLTQTGEKALAKETGTSGKDGKNGKSQKGGKAGKGKKGKNSA